MRVISIQIHVSQSCLSIDAQESARADNLIIKNKYLYVRELQSILQLSLLLLAKMMNYNCLT